MAWIGIVIICGAHFSDHCSQRKPWIDPPYRLYLLYIANTMPYDHFEFLRQYIRKGHKDYSNIQGECVLDKLMKGMQAAWNAGSGVTIDESMVKYCGQVIAFAQYLPAKPIKHGIKVFSVCCAYRATVLGLEIVTGSETTDNSPKAVVQ